MAIGDVPSISNYTSTSNTYSPGAMGLVNTSSTAGLHEDVSRRLAQKMGQQYHQGDHSALQQQNYTAPSLPDKLSLKEESKVTKRVVQVFIVDPDENVPVDQSLIYKSDGPFMTDLNDQELYFEVSIKELLDAHNEKRKKLINKKVKERTEHLEPVKIRDLKMVVTQIATF